MEGQDLQSSQFCFFYFFYFTFFLNSREGDSHYSWVHQVYKGQKVGI